MGHPPSLLFLGKGAGGMDKWNHPAGGFVIGASSDKRIQTTSRRVSRSPRGSHHLEVTAPDF